MKTLRQTLSQPKQHIVRFASIAMPLLIAFVLPTTAYAGGPATDPSCEGIQAAYPILGTQCENAYKRINHSPSTPDERFATFTARKTVLQIFRKAAVCNAVVYDTPSSEQQRFLRDEPGHLEALTNVRDAMVNANDRNIPPEFTIRDLREIRMTRQQCK
ncbi:hypothetical protein [Massilia endophytica]|uniref:hypothetical protein n=1 Tax=Massilia endophytica TaxID=2899220 RepID=UPI001E4047B8|nr:hypothetical protein [Massilia endophytica]UGQ47600.1 hypothetical protein LSQ66_03710 [Massilia endophytica]